MRGVVFLRERASLISPMPIMTSPPQKIQWYSIEYLATTIRQHSINMENPGGMGEHCKSDPKCYPDEIK